LIRDPGGPELARIIRKCLERDKTLRYQSAIELLTDLRRLTQRQERPAAAGRQPSRRALVLGGAVAVVLLLTAAAGLYRRSVSTASTFRSVAVMPFVNVDLGPSVDYQVDGLAESIRTTLNLLPDLRVIAYAAVDGYRRRTLDPRSVAGELDVEALVMGRAFRSGDTVTIGVEIVDARDNSLIWSEQYQRALTHALVQDDIPRAVSERFRPAIRTVDHSTGAARANSEAYQLYLQGRHLWHLWTQDGARRAVDAFEQAIQIDRKYALAYAGIAEAHMVPGTGLPQAESYARAREAAMKALELDPSLSEAHASLAGVLWAVDWDFAGADRTFQRAIKLNPNNIEAHHQYAHYLLAVGRIQEASAEVQYVLELDPVSLLPITHLGYHTGYTRQYDEALRHHARYLAAYSDEPSTYRYMADIYYQKGMPEQAFEWYVRFHEKNGMPPAQLDALKRAFKSEQLRGYWKTRIEQLQASNKPEAHSYPTPSLGSQIASLYARLGGRDDIDAAFKWLEKDFADHGEGLVHLREEILFDNLRSDPRFADLLRRIGLPPL
jgi:TolB-like protein/Flp pilus assembly protein TadD